MNIIKQYVKADPFNPTEEEALKFIERIARKCYKSENRITDDTTSAEKLLDQLFKNDHTPMMDHLHLTYDIVCDRGVSHEIVRHRIAAYAQESTRYCNYSKFKFGSEITVIDLASGFKYDLNDATDLAKYNEWKNAMKDAERHYFKMIELGATPQEARSVLPNSLKTEIMVTMDITAWVHFFYRRLAKGAHPQMKEISYQIWDLFNRDYPYLGSVVEKYLKNYRGIDVQQLKNDFYGINS